MLVTVQWPDGATSLEPIPNYHMEADCARRLKRAPEPAWRDDPSYSWRRGKR